MPTAVTDKKILKNPLTKIKLTSLLKKQKQPLTIKIQLTRINPHKTDALRHKITQSLKRVEILN